MNKLVILSILMVMANNCMNMEPEAKEYRYEVPAEIEPYVSAFKQEAAKYGVSIETDNLVVEYSAMISASGLAWSENGQNYIKLDVYSQCWTGIGSPNRYWNKAYREILVFHELSHIFLHRHHTTGKMPGSTFFERSIMAPSFDCFSGQLYLGSETRRAYYMRELFTGVAE